MKTVEVNITGCVRNNISPDKYVLLHYLYFKDYNQIELIFGVQYAIKLRNELCDTKYVLSNSSVKFTSTIISGDVKTLLGIRDDEINFWEWYNLYPFKVGVRILRAVNPASKLAIKQMKQYLSIVKTQKEHEHICKVTEDYLNITRLSDDGLKYLPQISTVLNNRSWETWESLTIDNDVTISQERNTYGTRVE